MTEGLLYDNMRGILDGRTSIMQGKLALQQLGKPFQNTDSSHDGMIMQIDRLLRVYAVDKYLLYVAA